jgi:LuxR family maltose regulon positive regulatory protein
MSKSSLHALIWSEEHQWYELTTRGIFQQSFCYEDEPMWLAWVEEQNTFAFEGRGGHLSIVKEVRARGTGYWYAYRRQAQRTQKRYLGHSSALTLFRLEETARAFVDQRSTPEYLSDRSLQEPTFPQLKEASSNPEMPAPLLETRYHPPRLPTWLVSRPHLLVLLNEGSRQKLTVIQAPAGSGKTTLATQWIAHRRINVGSPSSTLGEEGLRVGWISLNSGDNDPVLFWSSLITACRAFQGHRGEAIPAYLFQKPRLPFSSSSLETALTFLLNDLSRAGAPGVLILEDYHLIEQARIHEALAYFIEHLPANLHVMILTRSEPPLPLVRWRAQGVLLEIQSARLRFSLAETVAFLQQVIPQSLSEEAVRSLHTHIEGWAAGLRLLALSLQKSMTPQGIEEVLTHLSTSSASDHTHRSIQEYLLSEVLSSQPEPLQLFLLQTSILSRLTGSLCDAVTGQSNSAACLELVERSGFFLEALEGKGVWYRYHALWTSTMRAEASRRLGEETLRALALKASRWYEAHALLNEAIEAAFSAQAFEYAVSLIERFYESSTFSEYHTLQRWLEQLPEFLLRVHPDLCFCYAQALFLLEDPNQGIARREALLQMAEVEWRRRGDLSHLGMLYAFRSSTTFLQGLFAPAIAAAHEALRYLPLSSEPSDHHLQRSQKLLAEWTDWRCGCLITISYDAEQQGSFGRAAQILLEAHTLSLNNGTGEFTPYLSRALGEIYTELGELHQAASYHQQARASLVGRDEMGDDLRYPYAIFGQIRLAYQWNRLDEVEQLIREASLYRYRNEFPYWEEDVRTRTELSKLLLLYARGEVATVLSALSALFVHVQSTPNMLQLIPEVLSWQARLQIRDGDLVAAERTCATLARYEDELSPLHQQTLYLLYARLNLARGEAESALPILERLLAFSNQGKHQLRALEISLLLALAHFSLKQESLALRQLSLVLSQARSEGFIRLFLDEGESLAILLQTQLPALKERHLRTYAQSILRAFPESEHAKNRESHLLLESLSGQEQRVLALLVAGRSNPEIALELVVSVNTVKAHVKNLYRKLGVTNRMEASEIARREQLI